MVTDYDWRTREMWLVNEDGLWDISVSLGILDLGLTFALNQPIWFIALAILAYYLVIMAGKEVITRPRFYYFDISLEQLAKFGNAINIGSVSLILSFVSGAISSMAFDVDISWLSWFSDYEIIILGGIISTIMVIFGYLGLGEVRF